MIHSFPHPLACASVFLFSLIHSQSFRSLYVDRYRFSPVFFIHKYIVLAFFRCSFRIQRKMEGWSWVICFTLPGTLFDHFIVLEWTLWSWCKSITWHGQFSAFVYSLRIPYELETETRIALEFTGLSVQKKTPGCRIGQRIQQGSDQVWANVQYGSISLSEPRVGGCSSWHTKRMCWSTSLASMSFLLSVRFLADRRGWWMCVYVCVCVWQIRTRKMSDKDLKKANHHHCWFVWFRP